MEQHGMLRPTSCDLSPDINVFKENAPNPAIAQTCYCALFYLIPAFFKMSKSVFTPNRTVGSDTDELIITP